MADGTTTDLERHVGIDETLNEDCITATNAELGDAADYDDDEARNAHDDVDDEDVDVESDSDDDLLVAHGVSFLNPNKSDPAATVTTDATVVDEQAIVSCFQIALQSHSSTLSTSIKAWQPPKRTRLDDDNSSQSVERSFKCAKKHAVNNVDAGLLSQVIQDWKPALLEVPELSFTSPSTST